MSWRSLTRSGKEKLYVEKSIELQKIWGNPMDQDWDFDFKDATDEQVNKMLEDIIGQIRYEKTTGFINKVINYGIIAFVLLGVIGLLLFGIRQLFS